MSDQKLSSWFSASASRPHETQWKSSININRNDQMWRAKALVNYNNSYSLGSWSSFCCSSHPSHGGNNIKMLCYKNKSELAISIWKHNSFIYWLILILCRTTPMLFYFFFLPLYHPFLLILLPLLAFVWFYFGIWGRWNIGARGRSIADCIKADTAMARQQLSKYVWQKASLNKQ